MKRCSASADIFNYTSDYAPTVKTISHPSPRTVKTIRLTAHARVLQLSFLQAAVELAVCEGAVSAAWLHVSLRCSGYQESSREPFVQR
jgi:hypothetical protein